MQLMIEFSKPFFDFIPRRIFQKRFPTPTNNIKKIHTPARLLPPRYLSNLMSTSQRPKIPSCFWPLFHLQTAGEPPKVMA